MPNGKRHYRITLADALAAHDEAMTYGGLRGVPNLPLVESAIARPYSGYYHSIEKKAAALLQSVATNHGFADGNKRTAVLLLLLLLQRSEFALILSDDEAIDDVVVDVVNGRMSYGDLVIWLGERIIRVQQRK